MKKLNAFFFRFASIVVTTLFVQTAFAQLTVTVTYTGTAPTGGTLISGSPHASLAAAITQLNALTTFTGTTSVTLTCSGTSEIAPSGGYSITISGSSTCPITIDGANKTVTAFNPQVIGSINNAIFKLVGADYITLQNFTMQENASNSTIGAGGATSTTAQITNVTTGNNMTEWGVALLHASTTNGAQNNTIQNNTISLNRTYRNTFGIYSNNVHSATAPTGTEAIANNTTAPNNNNKIYGNDISNVNMGITFIGASAAANQDIGNDIGGTSISTGNTITNWGGASAPTTFTSNSGTSYCIFLNHQKGENVSYNTITSATISGTAVTLRGIFKDYGTAPTGTFTSNITNNTITITDNFTSGTLECIRSQGISSSLSTATINITNNTILNTSVGGASSSTTIVGIVNSSIPGTLSISNNIIRGTTSTATTGGFTGISNTGAVAGTITISSNQIGNASGNAITFSAATSGAVTGISNSGGTAAASLTIQSNDFRGITHTSAGSSTHIYITNSAATLSQNISSNTFTNLNINTSGSVTFISNNITLPASGTQNVNSNSIVTAFNKGASAGTVTLLNSTANSPTTATINQNDNTFSNITVSGTTAIAGWVNTDGSASPFPNKTITGNTFSNWTGGTGAITVMNLNYFGGTGTSSTIADNTITNITGGGDITGILVGSSGAAANLNIYDNIINTLSATGSSGDVAAMSISNASTNVNVYQNTINTLSSTVSGGRVYGMYFNGATTNNIYRNKIYDITNTISAANGFPYGIYVFGGTTYNISNNLVGDIRLPAGNNSNGAPLSGIYINGGTTANLYYNTVYIGPVASTGTIFYSAAIFADVGPTVTLRNNIAVNLATPVGSGVVAAAYYRQSGTLTTYGSASNNNLFYAGTPSASKLIYYHPASGDQSLADYKTRVGPTRDAASVSEMPDFLSTTGSSSNFLHIDGATASAIESGAIAISGFTDDYDAASIRTGYPLGGQANGGGTAPDIGADEGDFAPPAIPSVSLTINTATGTEAATTSITLTITATSAVTGDQTVDLALTGASSGDFSSVASQLTILNGATSGTSTFTITNDATYECTETATFTISNPSSGITLGTASQNLAITDNDFPTTDLSINTSTGTEAGTTAMTLTATSSANVIGAQTFDVTLSGTNVTNSDFSVTFPRTITIANGASTGTTSFNVANDVAIEGTETATFTLAATSACVANGTTLTQNLTITDNDFPSVNLSISPSTGTEAATTSITLTATASQAVSGDQTVNLALSGTGLSNADFTGITFPTTITILSGATTGSVTFNIADDGVIEGAETATFTISSPSSGISLGGTTTRTLAITDNTFVPIILSALNTPASENFNGMAASSSAATPTGFGIQDANTTTIATAVTQQASSTTNPTPTTGAAYNFGQGSGTAERSLGLMYSGSYSGKSIIVAVKNNTGSSGTIFELSFDYEQYRRNTATQTFKLQYSTSLTSGWADVASGNFSSMLIGASTYGFTTLVASQGITALQYTPTVAVPTGNIVYFRWILDGSSFSGAVGIDNFSVALVTVSCSAPADQASDISFASVAENSMTVNWTNGDGTNRVVYMNSSNSFTAPTDGSTLPSANTTWANSGQQLIYNGSGSSVSISSLLANTTYYFRIYEYNCSGSNTVFQTATDTQNPNSQTTSVAASSASVVQAVAGSEANTISSLINGTITSNSDGIQVWRFRLYDGDGTTNDADALPTIYKSWTIQADGANNTVPDWSTAIASRAFFLNSNTTPIAGGGLVNPTNIPFPVSSPYITVPDNGFVDIYMRITLANPLPANSDNNKFAFKLTQADVTVETSATSSQLATFSTTSNATKNVIDILATLQFINAPTTVGLGDAFTVTVSAVDANGNIDQNNTSLITLGQNTGTGTMTGGGAANLVAGTYTWTGLTYDTEETFQVIASGGSFSSITANITVTDEDFQLFDHFNRTASSTVGIPSSGGSTAWTETEAGDGTKVQIFSNMLLIDNCVSSDPSGSSGGTTTERINFNGENHYETVFNNSDGTMNWLFNMRTNNSNLSGFAGSAYGMAFILGCDQADFTASGSDGYAVVVGNSGTTDYIKLVRFANGLSADANLTDIVASDVDIDANYSSVKVSFNPCDGVWTLYARNDGASAFTAPNLSSPAFSGPFTATNTTHTALDLKYFGAAWKHNSSCVGNDTYWDNFYIPNTNTSVANTKIWNGSVSSNWNTAANWSPCPGVPTITDNVIIPVTANNPIISATPSGLCKDLTVNASAQLTINANQFLNAHGNVVNNGNANFGAGTLQLENTPIATVTVSGTINVGSLYNSNNATLSGTVTITDQARAETGGTLNANGNLVLNNGAQLFHGTGTTVPCACEGTVNGNIVVKRNGTSSSSVYNYWSTPISSASLGLLGGTNYLYNPANGTADFTDDNPGPDPGWAAASGSFSVGKGYAGQGPNPTVTFTGTANNGTLNQAVQYFTLVNGSTSPGVPYNLIGNPYPCNISASTFLTANNTKVTGAIYYWDDDITGGTGYAANDYAIWNGTGSTGGGGRTPNGMIATAQGFFVQALSGATSVSFTNAMRASTATTFFKTDEILPQRLWLRADNGTHTNQILVGYVDGATEDMDWFYDAQKLRGNHSVSFYSLLNDTMLLGIQGLTPLNGADPAPVPLGLYAGADGQYSIYIDSIENFSANLPINLLDDDLGIVYDLRNGPYVFQTAQGEDNDRFVLFPNEIVTAIDELDNLHLNIYPNPNNGEFTLMVNSGVEQQVNVSLFDVTGKLVLASDKTISSGNNFITLETQVAGVYMLKVETTDRAYNKRVVVY
ncbi:MAG: T9SS type A sorting domain-containing protein [Bacteroidia bacterium]